MKPIITIVKAAEPAPVIWVEWPWIRAPYKPWDGNQATQLFFPVFVSFLLILLSGLSEPIIDGVSVVKVDTGGNGTLSLGAWGWCARGVPGSQDMCSGNRAFTEAMSSDLTRLPDAIKSLSSLSEAIPRGYLIANGVFHVISAISTWMTVTCTLAASGYWHNKESMAWGWTRCSFGGTLISAIVILIAWGLDLGMMTRIKEIAIHVDGSRPSITPGPVIWMMMVGFILNFGAWLVRVTWSRRMPRPEWTIKGSGDFHDATAPPMSAALPPPEELPPSWESLAINDASALPVDSKVNHVEHALLHQTPAQSKEHEALVEHSGCSV